MATARINDIALPTTKPTYITGHCGNGNHEGTRNLSVKGTLMPSCAGEYRYRFLTIICNCFCHEMYRTMRAEDPDAFVAMMDAPPTADVVASATLGPLDVLAPLPIGTPVAVTDEHKLYRRLLDTGQVSGQLVDSVREWIFEETITEDTASDSRDRRRRGELEVNVEVVCHLWIDGKLPFPQLTTDLIAICIDSEDPPSQGAVHAVLTRWENANLATISRKPMRFSGFPDDVKQHGTSLAKNANARERDRRSKGFF